jgi:hypothetical protein
MRRLIMLVATTAIISAIHGSAPRALAAGKAATAPVYAHIGNMTRTTPQSLRLLDGTTGLTTFTGNGYQIGVPPDWNRSTGGSGPSYIDTHFDSADRQTSLDVIERQLSANAPRDAVRIFHEGASTPDKGVVVFGNGLNVNTPSSGGLVVFGPDVADSASPMTVANADSAATATLKFPPRQDSLLLAVRGDTMYLVVIRYPSDAAAQNQTLIQQIVQSFQLLPGAALAAASTPAAAMSGAAPSTASPSSASAPSSASNGTPPPSGTVLKADNYSDPSAGIMPQPASPPNGWTIGYVGGEYQIATTTPAAGTSLSIPVPGSYDDVSVSVDARLAPASDSGTLVIVLCRASGSGDSATYYKLYVAPVVGQWNLVREDPGNSASLTGIQTVPAPVASGAKLHLQLTCSGSTITASIGGQQVASVQDGTYKTGRVFLGAGLPTTRFIDPATGVVTDTNTSVGSVDVRFSGLVLTQP